MCFSITVSKVEMHCDCICAVYTSGQGQFDGWRHEKRIVDKNTYLYCSKSSLRLYLIMFLCETSSLTRDTSHALWTWIDSVLMHQVLEISFYSMHTNPVNELKLLPLPTPSRTILIFEEMVFCFNCVPKHLIYVLNSRIDERMCCQYASQLHNASKWVWNEWDLLFLCNEWLYKLIGIVQAFSTYCKIGC